MLAERAPQTLPGTPPQAPPRTDWIRGVERPRPEEQRARALEQALRTAAERVRYRQELLAGLAEEEARLRREIAGLEDTLRCLDRDSHDALAQGRDELARMAVRAFIEKRKQVARLRAHMLSVGEALEHLVPELERSQAEYAAFRRRARAREGRGQPQERPIGWAHCRAARGGAS